VITVSALIPSIGRKNLARAIDSVLDQHHAVHEVVVINDSAEQTSCLPATTVDGARADGDVRVVEVFTGGRTGAANARNTGLKAATGSHIAYLDDDDIWLPHHIGLAVRTLQQRPGLDVYTCSALLAQPDSARVVPKVRYNGRGPLLDFFFGSWSWAGRYRSIPCTGWVFPRELGVRFPLDTGLDVREDVWWLLEVNQAGHSIWQSPTPGTIWFEDPDRTAARMPLQVELAWARRLDGLRPGSGANYLVHTAGRTMARAGDRQAWSELMDSVDRGFPLDPGQRVIRRLEEGLLAVRGRGRPDLSED